MPSRPGLPHRPGCRPSARAWRAWSLRSRPDLLPGRGPEVVAAAVMAWTQLLGMVGFELFGHYVGASTNFDARFDYEMRMVAHLAGLDGS